MFSVLQRSTMFFGAPEKHDVFGAPEEHDVYSPYTIKSCALQRSAMWYGAFNYIPLLTERDKQLGNRGYKHVAPPEQEPSIPILTI